MDFGAKIKDIALHPVRLAFRTAATSLLAGVSFGALYAPFKAIVEPQSTVWSAMSQGSHAKHSIDGVENWLSNVSHHLSPRSKIMRTAEKIGDVLVVIPADLGGWVAGGAVGGVVQGGKEVVVWGYDDLTGRERPAAPQPISSAKRAGLHKKL